MSKYRKASLALDAAYRGLADRLTLAQQLALSREETIWLNEEQIDCAPAGIPGYVCKTNRTSARAAALVARQAALPARAAASVPPPPATPANAPANAAEAYVPVTAMPWLWKANGENQAFKFGYPNGTAPVAIPLDALSASPGDALLIRFNGGIIRIGPGGPPADGGGYTGLNNANGARDDTPGKYIKGNQANLGALVGVFTDKAGNIVDAPFEVGAGKVVAKIPPRAARLQLGINDDIFGGNTADTQNTGGFKVLVMRQD